MRLFLGVRLPEEIKSDLGTLCQGLKDVRWVNSANFHLTLNFLGELTPGEAEDLDTLLMQLRHPVFDLFLSGVGVFESKNQTRVIWAGVEGARDALSHLQHKTTQMISDAGLQPEHRKFKPHVTLSYTHGVPSDRVGPYLSDHEQFKTAAFTVTHLTLFRSYLGKGGAHYEPLQVYPLSGF